MNKRTDGSIAKNILNAKMTDAIPALESSIV